VLATQETLDTLGMDWGGSYALAPAAAGASPAWNPQLVPAGGANAPVVPGGAAPGVEFLEFQLTPAMQQVSAVPLGHDPHAAARAKAQRLAAEQDRRASARAAFEAANPGAPVPAELQPIHVPKMLERTGVPTGAAADPRVAANFDPSAMDEFGHIEERNRGVKQFESDPAKRNMTDAEAQNDPKSGLGYSVTEVMGGVASANQERTMPRLPLGPNNGRMVLHQADGTETQFAQVGADGKMGLAVDPASPQAADLEAHYQKRVDDRTAADEARRRASAGR
jgi:hypothetical protein